MASAIGFITSAALRKIRDFRFKMTGSKGGLVGWSAVQGVECELAVFNPYLAYFHEFRLFVIYNLLISLYSNIVIFCSALIATILPCVHTRPALSSPHVFYLCRTHTNNSLTGERYFVYRLVKVDRAAMGVSLESRVPILDHRVVEFAWRLPQSMKLRDRQTKWAFRQMLYRHVPKKLIERPKMNFSVPLDSWLRGPLRDWAESLLDEKRLRLEGYFHTAPIRQMWAEHLSGRRNFAFSLWNVLMFQAWLEANE